MKTWKKYVDIPRYGICRVKEASDKESTGKIAPISHGFVNLYKAGKWVNFCGVLYAKRYVL